MSSDTNAHTSEPPDIDTSQEGLVLLPDDGRQHVWDKRRNVRRLLTAFFVACFLILSLDVLFLLDHPHKHLSFKEGVFPPEGWFGFYSFYGLAACVLLVLAAKQLRKLIMRWEDYYDR